MQPRTRITIQSNALGILPPQFGSLVAMVGTCTAGTANLPQSFGTIKSLRATLGDGPLVEAAAHAIERYGNPVLCVKSGASVAGEAGAVEFTGTGTSVVTVASGSEPVDDFEIFVAVITGGTVGTAGIELQWSRDGGRTMSGTTALGVALTFEIPGSGVELEFAAGTLVAGDTIEVSTTAPQWNATELQDALIPLDQSQIPWDILYPVGPIVNNDATLLDGKFAGYAAQGKFRMWIASTRIPDVGETDGVYQTSLISGFSSVAVEYGSVCAGAALVVSSVSAETFLRPWAWVFTPWLAHLSEEVDASALRLGALPCTIYDENGNLLDRCHDETVNPGLDDARFTVARSWVRYAGTYVNNPRMMSAEGSDFKYCQSRRVINIAARVLQRFFDFRLSVGVATNTQTGKILEEDAKEMESGAVGAMEAAIMAVPKASGVSCVVSRDDLIIQTETLHVTARVQPLGYPKLIEIDLAFQTAVAATSQTAVA